MDTLEKLYAVCRGLNRRFADGNEPFQIMTRLLEECGELAEQVNHFEGRGVKHEKHGEPDKAKLAKEVMDVLRCALQVAMYYGIEQELEASIGKSYQRVKAEGLIYEHSGAARHTGLARDGVAATNNMAGGRMKCHKTL